MEVIQSNQPEIRLECNNLSECRSLFHVSYNTVVYNFFVNLFIS